MNRFTKFNQPFKCLDCGKLTANRDTNTQLCDRCDTVAGLENGHSDEGHDGDFEACPACQARLAKF